MANIERTIAQIKNRVADTIGEGGQIDLDGGRRATWSWCNDKRYPSPRYKFVSITGDDIHQSGIFDTETGNFVS
jgi:hypothetical protein